MSSASDSVTRRGFLKSSAAAGPALGLGWLPAVHAAGSDTIRLGLIGCGGRGTEASTQAMNADRGVRLVAMADMRADRAQEKRNLLRLKYPDQVIAGDDQIFEGFDAYKEVIALADVVIIANAAKFHPLHAMAAIQAGKHVFVEKPHGIDPAGIQMIRAACELAREKNLSLLSGLQSRFLKGYQETIQRIHDGAIGDIVAIQETWLRPPYVLYPRVAGLTEAQYQGSNQYHFYWLSGDDVPQTLIHNFDRARWALGGQSPVKCRGMGGRSTLHGEIYGSTFDHHSMVFEFASGVRLYASCRTIDNCYNENSSMAMGTKGRAFITDQRIEGENPWRYDGPRGYGNPEVNPYQLEHNELFRAIRSGNPINSADYMVPSTLMGIMGQLACYSGQEITWEQVSTSDFYYAPRPEECSLEMEPPVRPGPDGVYPVPFTPGVSTLV